MGLPGTACLCICWLRLVDCALAAAQGVLFDAAVAQVYYVGWEGTASAAVVSVSGSAAVQNALRRPATHCMFLAQFVGWFVIRSQQIFCHWVACGIGCGCMG